MPRRRPHLTRTTIGLLLAVAVWVAAVAVGAVGAEPSRTRAWFAREVAQRLVSGDRPAACDVADVRVSLAPPRLDAEGLRGRAGRRTDAPGRGRRGDGGRRADSPSREIGIDHLRLKGVVVNMEIAAGVLSEAVGRRLGPGARCASSRCEDLQIAKLALPGGIVLTRPATSRRGGTGRGATRSARRSLHVGSFSAAAPRRGADRRDAVMAWGRKTDQGWELGPPAGPGPRWSVDARGSGAGADGRGEGTADGRARGARARARASGRGSPGTVAAALAGDRQGHASSASTPTVTSPAFEVAGLAGLRRPGGGRPPLARRPRGHPGRRRRFAGGELEGSYTLGSLGPPWRHRVAARGRGVRSRRRSCTRLGAPTTPGSRGRCRVNADVAWDGARSSRGPAPAVADSRPGGGDVPVAGRVVVIARPATARWPCRRRTPPSPARRCAGTAGLTLGTLGAELETSRASECRSPAIARLLRGWVGTDVLPRQLHGRGGRWRSTCRGRSRTSTVAGDVALAPVSFGPVRRGRARGRRSASGTGCSRCDPAVIYVGPGRVTAAAASCGTAAAVASSCSSPADGVPLARMVAWGGVHAPLAGQRRLHRERCRARSTRRSAEAALQLWRTSRSPGSPFGDGTGQVHLGGRGRDRLRARGRPVRGVGQGRPRTARGGGGRDALRVRAGGDLAAARPHGGRRPRLHAARRVPVRQPGRAARGHAAPRARAGWSSSTPRGSTSSCRARTSGSLAGDLRRNKGEFRGKLEFGVESWHLLAQGPRRASSSRSTAGWPARPRCASRRRSRRTSTA